MSKFLLNSVLYTTKQARKMAELAFLKTLFQLVGGSYYCYVLFINIDNIKGWILIGIAGVSGLGFGIAKLYFYVKREKRIARREEYDLWNREMDKQERIKRTQSTTQTNP